MEIIDLSNRTESLVPVDQATSDAAIEKMRNLPSVDLLAGSNHRRGLRLSNKMPAIDAARKAGLAWVCIEYGAGNAAGIAYEIIAADQWGRSCAWAGVVMQDEVDAGTAPSFDAIKNAVNKKGETTLVFSIGVALGITLVAPVTDDDDDNRVYIRGSVNLGMVGNACEAKQIQTDVTGFLVWQKGTWGQPAETTVGVLERFATLLADATKASE